MCASRQHCAAAAAQVRDGQLHILQEGRTQKLVPQVLECTFNGPRSAGKDVLYVTERAVLRLMVQGGVELLEVAPGIDLQKQVLDLMGFKPYIANGGPKLMDARMFAS
jgi:propionate CoA-transferase